MFLLGRRTNIPGINQRGLASEWGVCSSWKDLVSMLVSCQLHCLLQIYPSAPPPPTPANWVCVIHSLPHAPVKSDDRKTYFPDYPLRKKLLFQPLDGWQHMTFSSHPFKGLPWIQIVTLPKLYHSRLIVYYIYHKLSQAHGLFFILLSTQVISLVDSPSTLVSAPQINLTRWDPECTDIPQIWLPHFLPSDSTPSLMDFKNIFPPS